MHSYDLELPQIRILITIDRYETELPLQKTLFYGPAPSDTSYYQVDISYPNLRVAVGEDLEVLAYVRDQRKDFTLTSDLGANVLTLKAWQITGRGAKVGNGTPDASVVAVPDPKPGLWRMKIKACKPGYLACRVYLNQFSAQNREAIVRVCKGKGLFSFFGWIKKLPN